MTKEERDKFKEEKFVTVPVYRGFLPIKQLYYLCEENDAIILGGYVRWMCSPNINPAKPGDVDVYCPEDKIFERMKSTLAKANLGIKNENDIAIAYIRPTHPNPFFTCPTIQLIKPMREGVIVTDGDMEEIIKNFDFTVIRIGLFNARDATADPQFIEDELASRLRIKNIHCPISSMYRVMKYRAKGYWPSTGLLLKLFLDWEERPEETKMKILTFYKKLEEDEKSVTAEQIDEMEALMRLID